MGGNAAIAINITGNTSDRNARFEVDDSDSAILIIRSTRPITSSELIVPWNGSGIWCNYQHSNGIFIMAIKTYGITIEYPTSEQGPWREVRASQRIKQILTAERWVPLVLPTIQPSLSLTLMPITTVDQVEVAIKSSRVALSSNFTIERFVISLCCITAVMAKTVRTEKNMLRGTVNLGANIAMGTPVLACLLDLPM